MPGKSFGFSESIIEELTHGDCWHLAAALSKRLKEPYEIIHGDGEMHHAGIGLNNGDVIDIEGIWNYNEWLNHWTEELNDVYDIFVGEPDPLDENYHLLRPDEDELLAMEAVTYGVDTYGDETFTLGEIADQIAEQVKEFLVQNPDGIL